MPAILLNIDSRGFIIKQLGLIFILFPCFVTSYAQDEFLKPYLQGDKEISTSVFKQVFDSIIKYEVEPIKSLEWINVYEILHQQTGNPADSLRKVKIEKAKRYNELAWSTNRLNSELAFKYLDTAQAICDEINYIEGTWRNKYGIGTIYKNLNNNDSALFYFNEYLDYYSDPIDSFFVANVQFQRGVVLMQMGKYSDAAEALIASVNLYEEMGEPKSQANSLNSLANVYKRAKLNEKALDIYDQVKAITLRLQDSTGYTIALINQGNLLSQINQVQKASLNYQEALKFASNNTFLLGYIYENWGNLLVGEKDFENGLEKLQKSLTLRTGLKNPLQIYYSKKSLGQGYYKMGEYDTAEKYLTEVYDYAFNIDDFETLEISSNLLSELFKAKGQYKKALNFRNENQTIKDSLLNVSIVEKITEANAKYETEKKEKEIVQLKSENEIQYLKLKNRNFLLAGSALGLLILSIFIFLIDRSRKHIKSLNLQLNDKNEQIQKALEEKNVLLKEIHHRVKNNLQVISSLLNLQSRNLKDKSAIEALNIGRSRVQSMSLIHQNLYQQEELTGLNIKSYFEKLTHNLFETYNLSNNEISITSQIDELVLDVDTLVPIGLILNELITNALKHAFPNQKGEIYVKIYEQQQELKIEVYDNGVGINKDLFDSNASYGNELIKALVNKLDGDIQINIDHGTQFIITIQNYQKAA